MFTLLLRMLQDNSWRRHPITWRARAGLCALRTVWSAQAIIATDPSTGRVYNSSACHYQCRPIYSTEPLQTSQQTNEGNHPQTFADRNSRLSLFILALGARRHTPCTDYTREVGAVYSGFFASLLFLRAANLELFRGFAE